MSTGQRIRASILFAAFAVLLSGMAFAATPAELDARLLALNERAFAIGPSELTAQELAQYEEAKRYLSDAQLNLNYGTYDVAEELLNLAEQRLDNLGRAKKASLSPSISSKGTMLIILIAIVVAVLFLLIKLLVAKSKNGNDILMPVIPQELESGRCPVCGGMVYRNVCVWCSFDYFSNSNKQQKEKH